MGPISAELPHWDNLALNLEMTLGKREGATLSRAKRGQNKAPLEMGSSWPFPSKRVGEKARRNKEEEKDAPVSLEKSSAREKECSQTLSFDPRPLADRIGRAGKNFWPVLWEPCQPKEKLGGAREEQRVS